MELPVSSTSAVRSPDALSSATQPDKWNLPLQNRKQLHPCLLRLAKLAQKKRGNAEEIAGDGGGEGKRVCMGGTGLYPEGIFSSLAKEF